MPVFGFPKYDDLRKLCVRFVNRNFGTHQINCLKYFKENFIHKGASAERFCLLYNLKPVPTIYPATIATIYQASIAIASLPVIFGPRKSPTRRIFQEHEYQKFLSNDVVEDLNSFSADDSPAGYLFSKFGDCIVFHKIIQNELHKIFVQMNIKIFDKNLPVSIPPWLRVTHQCMLKRRSML